MYLSSKLAIESIVKGSLMYALGKLSCIALRFTCDKGVCMTDVIIPPTRGNELGNASYRTTSRDPGLSSSVICLNKP